MRVVSRPMLKVNSQIRLAPPAASNLEYPSQYNSCFIRSQQLLHGGLDARSFCVAEAKPLQGMSASDELLKGFHSLPSKA